MRGLKRRGVSQHGGVTKKMRVGSQKKRFGEIPAQRPAKRTRMAFGFNQVLRELHMLRMSRGTKGITYNARCTHQPFIRAGSRDDILD